MNNNTSAATDDAAAGYLSDDDPMWAHHSGGGRDGREWDLAEDLARAQAFYVQLNGKAKIVLDLLIDRPGRLLSVAQICAMMPDVFENASAIAGAMHWVARPVRASERRYPFYWWKGRPGQTRYAMKPQVAELFRQARAATPGASQFRAAAPSLPGTIYRPQDENADVAAPDPADPDTFGCGLRCHRRLQNQLARLVDSRGYRPLSPPNADLDYDLAWIADDGTVTVVEVKSTTDDNERHQLRLGLGQVLDYSDALRRGGFRTQPVLYVQHAPTDERWIELARAAGVILGWPGAEDRFGLPTIASAG